MARAALRELRLDRILWLPTGRPGYRRAPVAPAQDRVAMLRLAVAGEPRYRIDQRELRPRATGYTVDTLRALRRENLRDLYLVIGADQHAKLGSWRRPGEVRRLAQVAVAGRPGFRLRPAPGTRVVRMRPMKISASEIRSRVSGRKDISGLVPKAVADYIDKHKLYR
jgi:nicotinate-nucleotide adenylyltransferase